MHIKNCVIKRWGSEIWLHHTASAYKVRMNEEALSVLSAMAARPNAAAMSEKERFIYDKLAAKDIAGEDTGREDDRGLVIKQKSPLESIELELSGRCNLRCAHCFASLSQRDMERGTLDKVFSGIDALEPVNLALSGGEPLLNPLLKEALQKAGSRSLRVSVMTNATLADEATADMLKEFGVASAMVSLDFFEETHDAIRGRGAYQKALRGIRLFVARKVPVVITAMVQDGTSALLEEFKRFCLDELGAAAVRFSAIMPIGKAKDTPGLSLSAAKTKDLFNRGIIPAPGESAGVLAKLAGGRNFYCKAGVGQCFVSGDGKMYACHYFQNLGESMGDLAERSFADIYRDYSGSGAAPVDMDWNKLEKCKACAHFAKCQGGCRARARLLADAWYAADPYSCATYGEGESRP